MVIISAVSDLHLEFADCKLAGGDFIVLAGDIWTASPMNKFMNDATSRSLRKRYERFCWDELSKYNFGVMVAGNHEYYGGRLEDVPDTIRRFLADHAPHIRFLDNDYVTVNGITFLGTTLWAPSGMDNPVTEIAIQKGMNDFKRIHNGTALFTPADAGFLFRRNMGWLARNLEKYSRRNCVVVTHHSPTFLGVNDEHATSELIEAYCSNLHDLIEGNPQIKSWFFGHTHAVKDLRIGKTVVRSNPRGYHSYEAIASRFDSTAADIEIETKG
jgi:hypothetical protein